MKKRVLGILLSLCMALLLFPATALAEGESPEKITEVAISGFKPPVIGEHPDYSSWIYSTTPSRVVNVGFRWYQISKEAYTGAADDNWELISSGYSFSKDYYYLAAFSVQVGNSLTATHIIPDDVKATVNGESWDIQVASDGLSCQLSRIFKVQQANAISKIAVTVDEPVIGAKPDFEPEFTATPAGSVTLDKISWYKISEDVFTGTSEDEWDEVYADDVFEAGCYYSVELFFAPDENYSLSEDITAAVNGMPHDDTYGPVFMNNSPYAYVCGVFGPLMPPVTLTAPFATTVEQGGSAAPGETVFTLELVDARGEPAYFDDVEIEASVTTNGAGSYKENMTFTGSLEDLRDMLGEGVFVRQANSGEDGWTYDDTVWWLRLYEGPAEYAVSPEDPEYIVLVYPTLYEETDDGGKYYRPDWSDDPLGQMSFTNTYTKNTANTPEGGRPADTSRPGGPNGVANLTGQTGQTDFNPNTGALEQTGGSAVLCLTLLAVGGVICAVVSRRRSVRAK